MAIASGGLKKLAGCVPEVAAEAELFIAPESMVAAAHTVTVQIGRRQRIVRCRKLTWIAHRWKICRLPAPTAALLTGTGCNELGVGTVGGFPFIAVLDGTALPFIGVEALVFNRVAEFVAAMLPDAAPPAELLSVAAHKALLAKRSIRWRRRRLPLADSDRHLAVNTKGCRPSSRPFTTSGRLLPEMANRGTLISTISMTKARNAMAVDDCIRHSAPSIFPQAARARS